MSYRYYTQNGYNTAPRQGDSQANPKNQPPPEKSEIIRTEQQIQAVEQARQIAERANNMREVEAVDQAELASRMFEAGRRIKELRQHTISASNKEQKNAI